MYSAVKPSLTSLGIRGSVYIETNLQNVTRLQSVFFIIIIYCLETTKPIKNWQTTAQSKLSAKNKTRAKC